MIITILSMTGCGLAQQIGADEISFHGFFGEGQSESTGWSGQPSREGYLHTKNGGSSENEFWMLGATVTFYLDDTQHQGKHHTH